MFFISYWIVQRKSKNGGLLLILSGSYFFYANWNWKFLILIIISTLSDFLIGLMLEKQERKTTRKILLGASLIINLGLLGTFKYYDFFISSFKDLTRVMGLDINVGYLNLILPAGISFYTFQTLSYTIDIFNKRINAEQSFLKFASFVAFFPQLVAGPIERAKDLLPQFNKNKNISYEDCKEGIKQIVWGLFKKVVVADGCAYYVNTLYQGVELYDSSSLIIGSILFSFQIYGDFSGYSDIAIGSAKMLGFNLKTNFKYPYFSRDLAEFWRKWHISLTTWFRDYLYFPLGGSKGVLEKTIRNIFLIFLISGLWHGANYTFIAWGLLNALFFVLLLLFGVNRANLDDIYLKFNIKSFKTFWQIFLNFFLVSFLWIFFRSDNLTQAISFISKIISWSNGITLNVDFDLWFHILLMLFLEWINRNHEYGLKNVSKNSRVRNFFYVFISLLVIWYFNITSQNFIYFQF